jgi:hypothetical protein
MLETTLERYGQTFFVKGEAKGKVEGKAEGKVEGKAESLILLLEQRFGSLSDAQKELIYQFNENAFTQVFKKLFTLNQLDDVFKVD